MNSLLAGAAYNRPVYRLYSDKKVLKIEKNRKFKNRNEHRSSKRGQLLSFIWKVIRYHFFYFDLEYFAFYFNLIKRKTFCRKVCKFIQGSALFFSAYYTALWLCSPLLPPWAHLIAVDFFYLLGVDPSNYLWLVVLGLICAHCTDLLLTGNIGITVVILYHLLIQQDSSDFVYPLIDNGNTYFRKYLPFFEENRKRGWWKGRRRDQKSGKMGLSKTTWAQLFQKFAVKMRSGMQVLPFLSDLYILNLLLQFTIELLKLFSGLKFALMYTVFFVNGFYASLLLYVLYEVLALLATLGATLGISYYVLLDQIAALIGLKKRRISKERTILSERTFSVFRFYIARCVGFIGDFNAVYGRALAFYYLFCYPFNAAIVVTLIFRSIDWLLVASASVLSLYQLLLMVCAHVFSAQMTAKLHRPAKWLIGAEVSKVEKRGESQRESKLKNSKRAWESIRVRLQLANYIAHFHTNYQYAMTYGTAGNVTFRSFTQSIFYYLKFLIFAVKIYFNY